MNDIIKILPVITKAQVLPFEQLKWENFEQLCLKIAQKEFSIKDCEKYGTTGQNQQGIDIFAMHEDGKFSTYQCKKYNKFTIKDLDNIIDEFKKGEFFKSSKRFVICTACELNSTQIQDAFNAYKLEFKFLNIELIKWDKLQLSLILKNYPDIVLDLLGIHVYHDFIGIDILSPLNTLSNDQIITKIISASCELSFINNTFRNLPDSHIQRKETKELFDWILKPLEEKESNISVLVGNAGTGKTVVLKDLFDLLTVKDVPVLGLKADKKPLDLKDLGKTILGFDADIDTVFSKLLSKNSVVVVLIDQIDALSQSLSTNRQQINTYTSLINQLSLIKGLRIIISCRIFDLNHDAELRQYTNKKEIRLSLLTENEVGKVLFQLTNKELNEFPKEFIELLKTPLHLDLFCRIYNESTEVNKIKTNQDLFRQLWKIKVIDVKLKSDLVTKNLEEVLYKLARSIYDRQDNLSAPAILFDQYDKEIEYLRSEYLVVEYRNNEFLQFFHQSFYDYTFSRDFVEKKGGNVYGFLKENHQGLFIRSLIKQVLFYLRIYAPNQYNIQINKILLSKDIRYHLKLLLIDHLSFEDNPTPSEFDTILSLAEKNSLLISSFFEAIPKLNWLIYFKRKRIILIDFLNSDDEVLRSSFSKYIVFTANNDLIFVFNLLQEIKDKEIRNSLINWILIRANNFSQPIVSEMYYTIEKDYLKNDRDRYYLLRQAIKSSPDFAINESIRIFTKNLPNWKKKRRIELNLENEEREFVHFCEDIYKEYPVKSYNFLKEIITLLAKNTIYDSNLEYKIIKIDYAFNDYAPKTYEHHKFIDNIVTVLSTLISVNSEFVFKELNWYLGSNLSTHILIALKVMSINPIVFKENILHTITNKELAEDCIVNGNLKYWYRLLLQRTYSLFSEDEQRFINNFILSFVPQREYTASKDHNNEKYKNPLYLYLGKTQWLLLNSISFGEIKVYPNLKLRFLELNRKYEGWNSENKEPNHNVSMAHACGGLVSKEIYKRFSKQQWYNSFMEFNEDKHYHNHWYLSLDEHAKAFKEVVCDRVNDYFSFVTELISDENVNFRYKINGLEGLFEGKYDLLRIRKLYATLMSQNIPKHNFYSFIRFAKVFIDESLVDDELIGFWKEIALRPFEKRDVHYYNGSKEDRNDELFTEAFGTPNAEALNLLVNLSKIEKYKDYVFHYLLDICSGLPIQLRLVVLSEVNSEAYFSNEQFLELFLSYTKIITPEIYQVAHNLINFLFSKDFKKLISFVRQTIAMPQAAKYLGNYLFFGWFYGYEESKELLLELHEKQPSSIQETIIQACKYLEEVEYRSKCLYILNRYSNDNRKNVREAYSTGFFSLSANNFPEIRPIIDEYVKHIDEDRLHSLYHYLIPCAKYYYTECIEIQHSVYDKKKFKYDSELKEPIELFTLCYNAVREYETNNETLEYTMDVFDKLLKKSIFKVEIDKILKDVDCM